VFQQPAHIQHSTSEFQQPAHIQHSTFHHSTDDYVGHRPFTLITQAQLHHWKLHQLPIQQASTDFGQQTQSHLHGDQNTEQAGQNPHYHRPQIHSQLPDDQDLKHTGQNQLSNGEFEQQAQTHLPNNHGINKTGPSPQPDDSPEQQIQQNTQSADNLKQAQSKFMGYQGTEETGQSQNSDDGFRQQTQSHQHGDQDTDQNTEITHNIIESENETADEDSTEETDENQPVHDKSQTLYDVAHGQVIPNREADNELRQTTQGQLLDDQGTEQDGKMQVAINLPGQYTQGQMSDNQDTEQAGNIQEVFNGYGQQTWGQLSDDEGNAQPGQIQQVNNELKHTHSQLSDNQETQTRQIEVSDNSGQQMHENSPEQQNHPSAGSYNSAEQQSAFYILNKNPVFEYSHHIKFGAINGTHPPEPHWWNTVGNTITSAYEKTMDKVTSTYDEAKDKVCQIVEKVKTKVWMM
jgi:hypothetical protein